MTFPNDLEVLLRRGVSARRGSRGGVGAGRRRGTLAALVATGQQHARSQAHKYDKGK